MRGKVAGRIWHKTCSFSLAIRIFALVTNKSLSPHCENRDMGARIAGWAYSELGTRLGKAPTTLVRQALTGALHRAGA